MKNPSRDDSDFNIYLNSRQFLNDLCDRALFTIHGNAVGDGFEAFGRVAYGVADVSGFDHIDVVIVIADADEGVTAELFLEPTGSAPFAVREAVKFDSEFPASRDVEIGREELFDLRVGFVGVVGVHYRDHFNEGG